MKRLRSFTLMIAIVIIAASSVPISVSAEPDPPQPLELVVVDGESSWEGEHMEFGPVNVTGKFIYADGPAPEDAFVVALCDIIRLPGGDVCLYDMAFSPSTWIGADGSFTIHNAPLREYAVVHVFSIDGWPAPVFATIPGTYDSIRFIALNDVNIGKIQYTETWREAFCSLGVCMPLNMADDTPGLYLPLVMRESAGDILTADNYDFPIMYGEGDR